VTTKTIIATHHDIGRCLAAHGVLTAIRAKYVQPMEPYRIVCFADHLHSTFPHRTLVQLQVDMAGPVWEGREPYGALFADWVPFGTILIITVETDGRRDH
jgi:hypothetical protein